MPTPLLETKLRPDWQAFSQARAVMGARLWRNVQAIVLIVMLVTLISIHIPLLARWQIAFRVLILTAAFWALPIQLIAEDRKPAIGHAALILGAGIIVAFSAPLSLTGSGVEPLPVWMALIAALTALLLPGILRRAFPHKAVVLGLVRPFSLTALTLGTVTGAAFGLHFWFVASNLPGRALPALPQGETLVWLLCWIALRAPGEELLFRGAGFYALDLTEQGLVLKAALLLALVNLFVHVTPIGNATSGPALWLLALGYTAAASLAMALLRAHERSLAPAIACNVVFSIFFAGVMWA